MNNAEVYRGLRFDRRPRVISESVLTIGAALVFFTLLWVFIPHGALYWLLLPLVGILVWVARFGWRSALSVIHSFMHYLEEF